VLGAIDLVASSTSFRPRVRNQPCMQSRLVSCPTQPHAYCTSIVLRRTQSSAEVRRTTIIARPPLYDAMTLLHMIFLWVGIYTTILLPYNAGRGSLFLTYFIIQILRQWNLCIDCVIV